MSGLFNGRALSVGMLTAVLQYDGKTTKRGLLPDSEVSYCRDMKRAAARHRFVKDLALLGREAVSFGGILSGRT